MIETDNDRVAFKTYLSKGINQELLNALRADYA